MSDVNISKYRAQVIRQGSTPASPGFAVAEGQNPVDPSGSGQTHLPVTIATATTGLSITESQILSGAGLVSQYIRGDGSLADFPATTGGGSSVSYYLNGSVSQGTIGGVAYKQLNRTPVFGAGTDFSIGADGYIASFITDASDPNKLLIPAGNWNFETYFSASSSGGSPSFYVELYKYDGTTFTLIATSSSAPELIAFGTSLNPYYSTLAVPQTTLALTDRLAIRYYVTHSGRTITLHTEDNHLCQIITTFTTGLTALNGLTAQVQNFAVGTSGTDFAIASATATHTFNLPTASATNRGALSSADWTTFNNKTSNLGTVTSVGLSSATSGVTIGSTPVTTSGTITLAIATASGSQNGLLSSTDWTTFNGKQNLLTNPVTGTGTTNYLSKFTGASAIGNSQVFDNGTNVGIGTATPSSILHLQNSSGPTLRLVRTSNRFDISADNDFMEINARDASTYMIFKTADTEKLRITSGGNVLIGTTTDNGAKLQVSGTATISNGLNVNSTGTEMLNINVVDNSSRQGIRLNNGINNSGAIVVFNSASSTGSETGGLLRIHQTSSSLSQPSAVFRQDGSSDILQLQGASGALRFNIASTGAATFSSSVTAGGLVTINKQNEGLILTAGANTDASYMSTRANNSTGWLIIGSTGSVANYIQSGTGANESAITTVGAYALALGANQTERMRITSGGNVLIGTVTNGASKLRIVGLPTSAAGLSSGDVYNLSGVLMIA